MLDVLKVREERDDFIKNYFKENSGSLILVRANYPGADKRNPYTSYVSYIFMRILRDEGFLRLKTEFEGEGLVYYLSSQIPADSVKELAVNLEENHSLGRLIDIDVYGKTGQVSRGSLRKCFICDDFAVICARERKHSSDEIKSFFKSRVEDYIFESPYKRITEFSMITELSRSVSLGTVNFKTGGNHTDMDIEDYYKSIDILSPRFEKFNIDLDYKDVKNLGIEIENFMNEKVGVNTYKGLIFHLLAIFYAEGKSLNSEDFKENLKKLGKISMGDFNIGLAVYKEDYENYGFSGARGALASGYEMVFEKALSKLFEGCNPDKIFIALARDNKDSNILRRAGIDSFLKYSSLLREIKDEETLNSAEEYAKEKNISAGGTADLLAVAGAIMMIFKKNNWEM